MKRPQNKLEEQDWIERYVLGQMSEAERLDFEEQMQNDAELKLAENNSRMINQIIQQAFLQEAALDTIKGLQQQAGRKKRDVFLFRSLAVAASLTIFFISYLSLSMPVFPDSENDFTVVRSTNATTMAPQQRVIFDQFFDGQAHIVEGQYAMAVRNFENVLTAEDLRPYFREAAQWHLIVAYLKSGDISRAQNLYSHFEKCLDCEYQVSQMNRWKIWWQIYWQSLI